MIIVEGADGTGKSTAAQKIADALSAPLFHAPGPGPQWLPFHLAAFSFHAANPKAIVVYDRFYYSEFIYGPILREKADVPTWFQEYAEKVWFPTIKPLHFFCDVDLTTALRSLDNEDAVDRMLTGNLSKILGAYRTMFIAGKFLESRDVIIYDWTQTELPLGITREWEISRKFNAENPWKGLR